MKYRYIDENRSTFAVKEMCQSFDVKPSGYYAWKRRGKSRRAIENEALLREIRIAHGKSKRCYGSPRITEDLRDKGYRCGENRVARLMRDNGIAAKTRKRYKVTTQSKPSQALAENLVQCNFSANEPNQLWTSDITYIWTGEGWLYLAAILDVYSRQIVGWSMSSTLTQDLAIQTLQKAVWRRKPGTGCIFHSDRGSQYAGHDFRKLLIKHGFMQSMSGKGNCYDNAIMETFFHTLKIEEVYFEYYHTRNEARKSIFQYIEVFYNRQRRHSALGYKSPVDFEQMAKAA
jgi:transposase InsO family protein